VPCIPDSPCTILTERSFVCRGSGSYDSFHHRKGGGPTQLDKAIDFERLYSEFMEIVGSVEEHLADIYVAKGGQLMYEGR